MKHYAIAVFTGYVLGNMFRKKPLYLFFYCLPELMNPHLKGIRIGWNKTKSDSLVDLENDMLRVAAVKDYYTKLWQKICE